MKKSFRNQFAAFVFLLAVIADVIQYNAANQVSDEVYGIQSQSDTLEFGDAVYVNADMNNTPAPQDKKENKTPEFEQLLIDRDKLRSEKIEMLTEKWENTQNTAQKEKAHKELLQYNANITTENQIEQVLKEKKIAESIITIALDGSVDAVVNEQVTTQAKAVQIADVIVRYADVKMSDIHIKGK